MSNPLQQSFFNLFVENHYDQPHRFYHTAQHIDDMLVIARMMGLELTPEQKMAVWFHDIVYIPGSPSNEANSCLLMETIIAQDPKFLTTVFDGHIMDIEKVKQIIMDTKTHKPTIEESKLVLDLDMEILGRPPVLYEEYVRNIRKEFAKFAGPEFDKGRAAFLRSVIGTQIFYTEYFKESEAQAQANLIIELATLS